MKLALSIVAMLALAPAALADDAGLIPDLSRTEQPCVAGFFSGAYVASCQSGDCGTTLPLVLADYDGGGIQPTERDNGRIAVSMVLFGVPFTLTQNGCESLDVVQAGMTETVDLAMSTPYHRHYPDNAEYAMPTGRALHWSPDTVVAGWLDQSVTRRSAIYRRLANGRDLQLTVIERVIHSHLFTPWFSVEEHVLATYLLRKSN